MVVYRWSRGQWQGRRRRLAGVGQLLLLLGQRGRNDTHPWTSTGTGFTKLSPSVRDFCGGLAQVKEIAFFYSEKSIDHLHFPELDAGAAAAGVAQWSRHARMHGTLGLDMEERVFLQSLSLAGSAKRGKREVNESDNIPVQR